MRGAVGEEVARRLNLLGADSVRSVPGDIVVIVDGPATLIVANDMAYAAKTHVAANPNFALIAALQHAGVSVRVCSQALVGNGVAPADDGPSVEVDVSGLTTMVTLQIRGWALIPD